MTAKQAMNEAKTLYDAEYKEFAQQRYEWISVSGHKPGGACYALSMHWIMSRALDLDWREPLTAPQPARAHLKKSLATESRKRQALERLPLRGWLASVTEILNNAHGSDRFYMQENFLNHRGFFNVIENDAPKRTRLLKTGYVFPEPVKTQFFLKDAGDAIKDTGENMFALIGFYIVGSPGHCVAAQGLADSVRYFDPNGGELTFAQRDQFLDWFRAYFLRTDPYQQTYEFQVDFYRLGAPVTQ